MTTTRATPILQVRVIGPVAYAQAVLDDRAEFVRSMLGSAYRYRIQTRSARKAGQIRVYLTITPQEEHHP